MKVTFRNLMTLLLGAVVLPLMVACVNNGKTDPTTKPALSSGTQAATVRPTTPTTPTTPEIKLPTIRIKAGSDAPVTDAKGVVWAADSGFDGGDTIDRPDLAVTGTEIPQIYHSERYSMSAYSFKVPNGKYNVKLHFSEDYEGITAAEDRMFTYAVKDGTATGKTVKEVKNFSPWKASGAHSKAYIDTIPVTVTAGQITITFTAEVENPQINALEIVPQ